MTVEDNAVNGAVDAVQILQLAGISAVIAGAVSALVNFVLTARESKRKRQAGFIENKLSIYSYFIFHLEKMRFKGEALKEMRGEDQNPEDIYAFTREELEKTVSAIEYERSTKDWRNS